MYKFTGKVSVEETGIGIPNLTIRVYNVAKAQVTTKKVVTRSSRSISSLKTTSPLTNIRGNSNGFTSLGSALTNNGGEFEIVYGENSNDQRSSTDTLTVQLAIEHNISTRTKGINNFIYTSKSVQISQGNTEVFQITIPSKILDKYQVNSANGFSYNKQGQDFKKILDKQLNPVKRVTITEINKLVGAAFKDFNLFSKDHSKQQSFYNPSTDDLSKKQEQVILNGLIAINGFQAGSKKKLQISLSESDKKILKITENMNNIKLDKVAEHINSKLKGISLIRAHELNCVQKFNESNLTQMPKVIEEDDCVDTKVNNEDRKLNLQRDIDRSITELISAIGSPESKLRYNDLIDQCYKNNNIDKSIVKVSLNGGPADTTSYHDFNFLDIAFEHIWTQMIDSKLEIKSKALYQEFVKIQTGYGEFKKIELKTAQDAVGYFITILGSIQTAVQNQQAMENLPTQVNSVADLENLLKYFAPLSAIYPHLEEMVKDIDKRLSEGFKFDIFAPDSINFGVLYTYRQKWEPLSYQVGRLISTIPLAPKEVRKYSKKVAISQNRNQKEIKEQDSKQSSESSDTSKFEKEIITKATNKTSFSLNANANFSFLGISSGMQSSFNTDADKLSQENKKTFRENVLKAAEEIRQQTRIEIESSFKEDTEIITSGEISNPNDEITVTYLFYELQRRYRISEQLYKVTPVLLVANEVPTPDKIDYDWLMANAWILRRVILDKMFLPALDYLNNSIAGEELSLEILKRNHEVQIKIVEELTNELSKRNVTIANTVSSMIGLIKGQVTAETVQVGGNVLTAIFGGWEKIKEGENYRLDFLEKGYNSIESRFQNETNKLVSITTEYIQAFRKRFDMEHQITLLRIHIKENILYYMQAIWDYEPPDQRFFRLYNKEIKWINADQNASVNIQKPQGVLAPFSKPDIDISLPASFDKNLSTRKLIEVADLDNILGYKGNYMIFPVKERSYLHTYMMQDYINSFIESTLKDPDEFGDHTTQEIIDYLRCLKSNDADKYKQIKEQTFQYISDRLTSPRKEYDVITIPSDSLFIEALPGSHPIMEDFKLAHRGLDVKKVQAEVRQMELENLRYASRIIEDKLDDPEVEKVTIKRK